jgi:hypothetical protein
MMNNFSMTVFSKSAILFSIPPPINYVNLLSTGSNNGQYFDFVKLLRNGRHIYSHFWSPVAGSEIFGKFETILSRERLRKEKLEMLLLFMSFITS